MLVAAFNFLSPPASWQQRLCLALQVWNLLECQEWDGLTHPACPNVFLQVVCSHFSIMDKQHQHLMMAGTVEFEAAPVEPQCSDHFPCVLIPHGIAEILSDSQFPNVKVDNIFLISWQVLFLAYKKLLLSPDYGNFSCSFQSCENVVTHGGFSHS